MFGGYSMMVRTFRRPAPDKEAWKPTLDRGPDESVHVPRRYRKLRLKRRRRAKVSGTSASGWIVILAILGAVAIFAYGAATGFNL